MYFYCFWWWLLLIVLFILWFCVLIVLLLVCVCFWVDVFCVVFCDVVCCLWCVVVLWWDFFFCVCVFLSVLCVVRCVLWLLKCVWMCFVFLLVLYVGVCFVLIVCVFVYIVMCVVWCVYCDCVSDVNVFLFVELDVCECVCVWVWVIGVKDVVGRDGYVGDDDDVLNGDVWWEVWCVRVWNGCWWSDVGDVCVMGVVVCEDGDEGVVGDCVEGWRGSRRGGGRERGCGCGCVGLELGRCDWVSVWGEWCEWWDVEWVGGGGWVE